MFATDVPYSTELATSNIRSFYLCSCFNDQVLNITLLTELFTSCINVFVLFSYILGLLNCQLPAQFFAQCHKSDPLRLSGPDIQSVLSASSDYWHQPGVQCPSISSSALHFSLGTTDNQPKPAAGGVYSI